MAEFTFNATRGYDVDDGNEVLAIDGLTVTYGTSDNEVTNFDFSDGTTGWTESSSTISIVDGKLKILNSSAGSNGHVSQLLSLTSGDYYVLVVDATYVNSAISVGVGPSSTSIADASILSQSASGRYILPFQAAQAATYVGLRVASGSTDYYAYFDNVSVYKCTLLGVDGTELLTNTSFTTDTTGWTLYQTTGTGAISVVSNQLLVSNNSSATYARAVQGFATTIGQSYQVQCDAVSMSSTAFIVITNSSTGLFPSLQLVGIFPTTPGTYSVNFIARQTTTYIALGVYSTTTTHTATFDNVSITPSTNLVANGKFYGEGTTPNWTLGTGWTISGGVASASSASGDLEETVDITYNQKYLLTFTINGYSTDSLTPKVGGTSGTAVSANGTYYQTITAGATNSLLEFTPASSFTGNIDDISLRPVVEDISANDDGLEIIGEVYKVPLSVGSNACGLGNFTSANYVQQPYTSALDFGTATDFSFNVWVAVPRLSATGYVFSRDSATTGKRFYLYCTTAGAFVFGVDDNSTDRTCTTTSTDLDDGVFRLISGTYDNSAGTLKIYVNGTLETTTTGSALLTITNTSAFLRIGLTPQGANKLTNGIVHGFRIYNTLLTDSQIAQIYENEKHLSKRYSYFTQIGTDYLLSKGLKSLTPTTEDNSTIINALDGVTDEVINHYSSTIFDLQTNLIAADEMQPWRELLHSTKTGETLVFKAGGRYEPNENTNTRRLSFSTPESREGMTKYFSLNMKLKEI